MNDPTAAAPAESKRELTAWYWAPFAVSLWLLKRSLIVAMLLLGALFSLAAVWGAWRVLDPPEPLRISEETTLITEPIAEDGLPDFAAALLDRMGRGTLPEDNGAIEFWRAIGPESIDSADRQQFFDELGCELPRVEDAIEPLKTGENLSLVAVWLEERARDDLDPERRQFQAEDLIAHARNRHWPGEGLAPLEQWVERNEPQLNLLVAAAAKPAFYSPPPNLLRAPLATRLFDALLPGVQGMRLPARGLALRVATALNQRQFDAAWRDAEAVLTLGERLTDRNLIIAQLVGIALRAISYDSIHLLVDRCDEPTVLRRVLRRMRALPDPRWAERALGFGETIAQLDYVLGMLYQTRGNDELDISEQRGNLDVNVLLQEVRSWQMRLTEIARTPDRLKRSRLAEEFEQDLDQLTDRVTVLGSILSILSRSGRSKMLARINTCLFMPATAACFSAEDRSCAQQRMTLLTAALKLHRLEHGAYPDAIAPLAPAYLEAIPSDPFTNAPFRYERRGEGFLLYSVGYNREDDGGSDAEGDFVDGEYAPIDWLGEREKPQGPDDFVVRLPIPVLELPTALPAE